MLVLFTVFLGLNSTKELAHEEYLVTKDESRKFTNFSAYKCGVVSIKLLKLMIRSNE